MVGLVTAASVQDRDDGKRILDRLRTAMPSIPHVFADGGYAGRLVAWARTVAGIVIEVVRRPADQRGFAALPRRWVVERTFAWLVRCRRLMVDYERLALNSEAMVKRA